MTKHQIEQEARMRANGGTLCRRFPWPDVAEPPNACAFTKSTARIWISETLIALVDVQDYPLVRGRKWRPSRGDSSQSGDLLYAVTGASPMLGMHSLIMGSPAGPIDHKNGNGLDNRRGNLRHCTHQQNACNRRKTTKKCTSEYKGVVFHKANQKFQACITANGKTRYLGSFTSDIAAARVYDGWATELHGEFALLNFPAKG